MTFVPLGTVIEAEEKAKFAIVTATGAGGGGVVGGLAGTFTLTFSVAVESPPELNAVT